jgi:hypothetical protein
VALSDRSSTAGLPPLDTTLTIVSPENIGFQFRLAGMAARSLAFLLDGPLIGLIAFGMVVGAGVFGLASESLGGLFLVGLFCLWWG